MSTTTIDRAQVFCAKCGAECIPHGCTTGYGIDEQGAKHCFTCCGETDRARMIATGRATLYLTCEPEWHARKPHTGPDGIARIYRNTRGTVSNWPGSLKFQCFTRTGRHNIAGTRYDVWFTGPDGYEWHGVTFGENTQICHCKRTKTRKA